MTRTYYFDEPRVMEYHYAPPITVTAPPATEDEIITRDAQSVEDVRNVVNDLRPRVGGMP